MRLVLRTQRVVEWAARDLALHEPVGVFWFARRRDYPTWRRLPEKRPLTREETVEGQCDAAF